MQPADFKKAKSAAEALLQKFDITEPVIPVDEIAQREGIKIQYFTPPKAFGPDVPTHDLSNVSGFFDPVSKTIFVNSNESPVRQLFTIAHELGHHELSHQAKEFDVLYRFESPIDKTPTEQEANSFAANLLVPQKMLAEVMEKYSLTENDSEVLANLFGVSLQVMKYRLRWMENAKSF